ncbi:acetoacetyl-CoA synthetase [Actinoplanes campanulatus]|uniref:Acetoacetyl-CoA synthetase n=1 Tax=Actinoplanes campanulatus TaxID=113559 RepID=A0A7W5AKA0_9ACTN|nr:acetoacetate--CoA ligase [Actinoplanes campanulatus]MBB3097640.1 acetoacetyl-CoA synthetase [Actinoplanes campanulatus]GGN28041.1 acetoacetyl-CoA synthetase [Actinoplanes campanulatus]GID37896.1 acetoacetyl-CoA synthetase [Actinoplanes campanulatus]
MTTGVVTAGTLLWEPPADIRETSRIGRYLEWLERERGLSFADYAALWEWSVTDLTAFWGSIWEYFEVVAHEPATAVLDGTAMPGARWFPGATLNYTENVLRMPGRNEDDPVVIAYSQSREPVTLTGRKLREEVRRIRAGLKARGVGKGDRVAAYAPNIPETYVLMLATASLGAVFSSCAPEFGARSVIDRWSQIEPKVLVATDGYRYGDKDVDRRPEIAAIRAAIPSIEHVITIGYLSDGGDWDDLGGDDPLEFEPVPFDHPLYVLYSSGTTGLPKPIVHGHGGILLEHLKILALHHDLGPSDRFFWFTTTGWMMWNYLASGPAVGAAIVLFDGNPGWPSLDTLWDLIDTAGITYFGTSAPYLLACRKAGITPGKRLKGLGSTGAPLPPEGWGWVYEAVSREVQLTSLSGGTDVCTGFVGGAPLLPVRAGVITCRSLGARVEAFDPEGKPVIGGLGELVITAPMPSMPVGFWNDPDGSRYREAYFDVFPGVWRHGDWITIDPDGSCVITGRSDATLNRGGVRLGTAEFYSVVEGLPEIADSLVVHLDKPGDPNGELLLFVVLAEGLELDDALRGRIARELRGALSPRHVPDAAYQVRALPRTLSGKKLEVPVKRILTGTPVESAAAKGALANPDSLNAFADLARERVRPASQ